MKLFGFILLIGMSSCATPDSVTTKEIPHDQDGNLDLYYSAIHSIAGKIPVDTIEEGYDSLQIRIWYDYSVLKQQNLLVIKFSDSTWKGTIFKMLVENVEEHLGDNSYRMVGKSVKIAEISDVVPKSGWRNLMDMLLELQILTLPNMNNIPGVEDNWLDGEVFSFEIAQKNSYRFYSYHMPDKFPEFWQAINTVKILNVIEQEFGLKKEFVGEYEPVRFDVK